MTVGNGELGETDTVADDSDPFRVLAERLPRPFRFLAVGALGLITDLGVFTIVIAH